MPKHEVWFAIPSANPENCRQTLPKWREMGYRVAILQNRERVAVPADVVVWRETYPGWAGSINELCLEVVPRSADLVVSGGDDMLPEPGRSAQDIAAEFFEHFPDGFGVMQPQGDEFLGAGTFCGSPWFGRGWIEHAYQGRGPMWAGYRHNWADNELYWVAKGLGALWMRPDLTQRHEHFSRFGAGEPAYWKENVAPHDRADVEHFIARAWLGFPGSSVSLPSREGSERTEHRAFDRAMFEREYPKTAEAYWCMRYARELVGGEAERRLQAALAALAAKGKRRVGIFGAGTHTRSAGGALMLPATPVQVVCIIDDDPRMIGTRLWNYPVVSTLEAAGRELDAVVISSRTMEGELAKRCRGLAETGVEVVRLYENDG